MIHGSLSGKDLSTNTLYVGQGPIIQTSTQIA